MKKKRKLTRLQLEQQASMQALEEKWKAVPKFALYGKPAPVGTLAETVAAYVPSTRPPEGRLRVKPDSLKGSTAKRLTQQYSGTACMGVATMHKSNQVPVFSAEEAVDIAKMRRG